MHCSPRAGVKSGGSINTPCRAAHSPALMRIQLPQVNMSPPTSVRVRNEDRSVDGAFWKRAATPRTKRLRIAGTDGNAKSDRRRRMEKRGLHVRPGIDGG